MHMESLFALALWLKCTLILAEMSILVYDRGIIVNICLSILFYLFGMFLCIFLVLCLFYGFVGILDEIGGKELKSG